MIKANTTVGNILVNIYKKKTIIRTHKINKDINLINKLNLNTNLSNYKLLKNIINKRLYKKAEYSFHNIDNKENFHYGLNEFNYTHFTSPIRRYCDILIHKLIINYLLNFKINKINISDFKKYLSLNQNPKDNKLLKQDLKDDEDETRLIIEKMNNKDKNINKMERIINRLKIINILENNYSLNNNPIKLEAFIIDSNYNKKYISIYIPKFNCNERIYSTNQTSNQLWDIDEKNNIINNKIQKPIINKSKHNEIKYRNQSNFIKLYSKINIEIIPFLKSELYWNKIKIKIINIVPEQ